MPKLPDVTAFGARSQPNVTAGTSGGLSVLSRAVAEQGNLQQLAGRGELALAESLGHATNTLAVAADRIQSRQDAVARARDYGTFSERGAGELRRLMTEGDLSQPDTIGKYKEFLQGEYDTVASGHAGSEDSRFALTERMEGVRQSLMASAITASVEAQQELVNDHLGGTINRLVSKTFQSPASLVEMFRTLDAEIDNMAPALTPTQERAFRQGGRERITEGALGALISRGDIAGAKEVMGIPGLSEVLGDAAQARINSQLSAVERAMTDAETTGIRKRTELAALLGREPSESELLQYAGIGGAEGVGQTEEIGDATSPTGTRIIPRSLIGQELTPEVLARFPPGKPSSGLNIQFDPATGKPTSITTGRSDDGAGAGGMTPKVQGEIETKLHNATENLARIMDIKAQFKPEFQTIATRGAAWWATLKEKAGADLSEEDKKLVTEFSTFKRRAVDNLNKGIREATGAQMNEHEATRIQGGMPNPGTGVFDGDGPTEFEAKLNDTVRSLRLASARYVHSLQQGLDPLNSGITIDGMEQIMRDRMNVLAQEIKAGNPDISQPVLDGLLRARLAQEFGLF